jgi:hypothetical protein
MRPTPYDPTGGRRRSDLVDRRGGTFHDRREVESSSMEDRTMVGFVQVLQGRAKDQDEMRRKEKEMGTRVAHASS